MTSPTAKPTVLAITKDSFILRQVRLAMPLLNLKRQGLIADYFITNPSLFDLPDDYTFDVVWLQRVDDPVLLDHLAQKIDSHYLYDLDDLLVGRASFRGPDLVNPEAVGEGVRRCRVLTVPTSGLATLLQKYVGASLEQKSRVCPNAGEFPGQTRTPAQPVGLVLTASEAVALTASYDAVLDEVARFSRRHDLPLYYFGKPDGRLTAKFPRIISLGLVPYWHYHALLAALPPLLGVSPLETVADQASLDFINGKSDVKMVEFGGWGHPAVYSDAAPYRETDLRAGIVVNNTAAAWRAGLEAVYGDLWQRLDKDQEQVRELRNMNRVAAECWQGAITAARLPRRLTGREIKFAARGIRFLINAGRHLVYSQDYLFMKKLQSKVPAPLLRIAQRFY
ncbi:MAG: hypothetical protein AB1491_06820 [Thermodesulfobacteriota bacterium]